jgi:RimJ/RimL family protein N-acetyltransferase
MKDNTDKVSFRKVRIADAAKYVGWLNDPEVFQFLSLQGGLTLEKEHEWINDLDKNKNKHVFAICEANGNLIGNVELRVDPENKLASLGIFIGEKSAQNQGYGKAAITKMLEYGFNDLGLHRIELFVHTDNQRAIHLYEKVGFQREGRKRECVFRNNKYFDSYIMSILDSEWRTIK